MIARSVVLDEDGLLSSSTRPATRQLVPSSFTSSSSEDADETFTVEPPSFTPHSREHRAYIEEEEEDKQIPISDQHELELLDEQLDEHEVETADTRLAKAATSQLDDVLDSDDDQGDVEDTSEPIRETIPPLRRLSRTWNPVWTQPRYSPYDWSSRFSHTTGTTSQEASTGVVNVDMQAKHTTSGSLSVEAHMPAAMLANIVDYFEKKTYKEAMSGPDAANWKKAMDEEYASSIKNQTWRLEKLPQGRKAILNKWVFKRKMNPDGTVARYKAKLVGRGFS